MKDNELKDWHVEFRKVVSFIGNCSEDIKPYVLGPIEGLAKMLRAQTSLDSDLDSDLINIGQDKLMAILEYSFSLHEADELSYMLTDEDATVEDIKNRLKKYEKDYASE